MLLKGFNVAYYQNLSVIPSFNITGLIPANTPQRHPHIQVKIFVKNLSQNNTNPILKREGGQGYY